MIPYLTSVVILVQNDTHVHAGTLDKTSDISCTHFLFILSEMAHTPSFIIVTMVLSAIDACLCQ